MKTITLSDAEAEQLAGYLNDLFDDEQHSYRQNKVNNYEDDAAEELKKMVLINKVYKWLGVSDEDLFEAHGIEKPA